MRTLAFSHQLFSVTGKSSAFHNEVSENDFIVVSVGGVTHTLGVRKVESDTRLTLLLPWDGPDVSGLPCGRLAASDLALISAQTAADVARVIKGYSLDKTNWQQVFSHSGDIIVTLPDTSVFRGPGWRKITELLQHSDLNEIAELEEKIRGNAEQALSAKKQCEESTRQAKDAQNSAITSSDIAYGCQEKASQFATIAETAEQKAKASKKEAGSHAEKSKNEADRASASNPANYLFINKNLAELQDRSKARENLNVPVGTDRCVWPGPSPPLRR